MDLYHTLVDLYTRFLGLFPAPLQWLVTVIVLIGLIAAFANLIRYNWLFVILLIVLLPILFPVRQRFFGDIFNFFLFLLRILGGG